MGPFLFGGSREFPNFGCALSRDNPRSARYDKLKTSGRWLSFDPAANGQVAHSGRFCLSGVVWVASQSRRAARSPFSPSTHARSRKWGLWIVELTAIRERRRLSARPLPTQAKTGLVWATRPKQQGQPFNFGGYAGIGPSAWISNAGGAPQLGGPFTTLSLNVGAGPAKFSLQLSYGGGIWQLSYGQPIPVVSEGTPSISVSKITTKTTTTSGCH